MSVVNRRIRECIELSVECRRTKQIFSVAFIHFFDHVCRALFINRSQIFHKPRFYKFNEIIPAVHDKDIRYRPVGNAHLQSLLIGASRFQFKCILILDIQHFSEISCICIILICIPDRKIRVVRSRYLAKGVLHRLRIFSQRSVHCFLPCCIVRTGLCLVNAGAFAVCSHHIFGVLLPGDAARTAGRH